MNAKDKRREAFLPEGKPRWIRVYDNGGKTADRYTVVMTGRYRHKTGGVFWYLGMSGNPFHPQGVGHISESTRTQVDRPTYGHLGKRVTYDVLPENCKRFVMDVYTDLHDLK